MKSQVRERINFKAKILVRGLFFSLLFLGIIVLSQDLLIFPGSFSNRSLPPSDVEIVREPASDGNSALIWRVDGTEPKKNNIAIIFHGNGDTLASTIGFQRWFSSLGITSYAMEYRGYDRSEFGWPTEKGIYLDADATINLILKREKVSAKQIISFGNSVGTGAATYVAEKFSTGALVILAAYTSIPDVVRGRENIGFLYPFIWTKFPSLDRMQRLKDTCVIAAHGKKDTTIPYRNVLKLKEAYSGGAKFHLLSSETAGHNDIFSDKKNEIAELIAQISKGNC